MFEISLWTILWYLITLPFRLVKAYIWNRNRIIPGNDVKLVDNLYDLLDEVKHFAIFMNKRPVKLDKYKMKNMIIPEHRINLDFGSDEWNKIGVVSFTVNSGEKDVYMRTGGKSGGSGMNFDKHKLNFDQLAKEAYREIELYRRDYKYDNDFHYRYKQWKESMIDITFEKFNLEYNFFLLRRALIILSHDKNHKRVNRALVELSVHFDTKEKAQEFIEQINKAYSSRIVSETLLRT